MKLLNQNQENVKIKKKDKIYYAQILQRVGVYNILECTVRSVYETYFVCVEKRDKHAYLFNYTDIGNSVFFNRQDALEKVNLAEKDKIEVSNETYYEED
mgnify:CR=1 FL=1